MLCVRVGALPGVAQCVGHGGEFLRSNDCSQPEIKLLSKIRLVNCFFACTPPCFRFNRRSSFVCKIELELERCCHLKEPQYLKFGAAA